ncbi:hypothetical protein R3P38DRAFT_578799 [Favolaschia claudopus]|uniref:Uncharacterized protein n=1 Tax=Favolaschia claudopus TaxID=2862362 RepID=A0AAV9ZAZ5_9AGAR
MPPSPGRGRVLPRRRWYRLEHELDEKLNVSSIARQYNVLPTPLAAIHTLSRFLEVCAGCHRSASLSLTTEGCLQPSRQTASRRLRPSLSIDTSISLSFFNPLALPRIPLSPRVHPRCPYLTHRYSPLHPPVLSTPFPAPTLVYFKVVSRIASVNAVFVSSAPSSRPHHLRPYPVASPSSPYDNGESRIHATGRRRRQRRRRGRYSSCRTPTRQRRVREVSIRLESSISMTRGTVMLGSARSVSGKGRRSDRSEEEEQRMEGGQPFFEGEDGVW